MSKGDKAEVKVRAVGVEEDQYQRLMAIKRATGRSVVWLVRQALDEYFPKIEGDHAA